jgi:hypothetical protein
MLYVEVYIHFQGPFVLWRNVMATWYVFMARCLIKHIYNFTLLDSFTELDLWRCSGCGPVDKFGATNADTKCIKT